MARVTHTVFGEGSPHATVMLVGEQPGHDEDLAGRPFVGPAGKILDRALEAFVPSPLAPHVLATVHPSSILRAPDDETRHAEMARFTGAA